APKRSTKPPAAKKPKTPAVAPKKKTTAKTPPRVAPVTPRVPKKSTVAPRDKSGRITRNLQAKKDFMAQTGFPKGRPGYIVDHIVPLQCGGADTPANMQWQTLKDAKIKDRTERNCRRE